MAIKRLPVDLDEVASARDDRTGEIYWFLDLQTGGLMPLPATAVWRAEKELSGDDLDDDDDDDDDDEEGDEAESAARVVADLDRFVRIPPGHGGDAYQLMEDFIEQVPNERVQEKLWTAIAGKGGFRRFKDALFHYPDVRESWFAFEARAQREQAIEWLASIDVETTWEPPGRPNAPPPGVD